MTIFWKLLHKSATNLYNVQFTNSDWKKQAGVTREKKENIFGCNGIRTRNPYVYKLRLKIDQKIKKNHKKIWRLWRDSNPQSLGSKPSALSIRLHDQAYELNNF